MFQSEYLKLKKHTEADIFCFINTYKYFDMEVR